MSELLKRIFTDESHLDFLAMADIRNRETLTDMLRLQRSHPEKNIHDLLTSTFFGRMARKFGFDRIQVYEDGEKINFWCYKSAVVRQNIVEEISKVALARGTAKLIKIRYWQSPKGSKRAVLLYRRHGKLFTLPWYFQKARELTSPEAPWPSAFYPREIILDRQEIIDQGNGYIEGILWPGGSNSGADGAMIGLIFKAFKFSKAINKSGMLTMQTLDRRQLPLFLSARGSLTGGRLYINVFPISPNVDQRKKGIENDFNELLSLREEGPKHNPAEVGALGQIALVFLKGNDGKPVLLIRYNQQSSGFPNQVKVAKQFFGWIAAAHEQIIKTAGQLGIRNIYAVTADDAKAFYHLSDLNAGLNFSKPYKNKKRWRKISFASSLISNSSYRGTLSDLWEFVPDSAMNAPGGIDLSSTKADSPIERNSSPIRLHVAPAELARWGNAPGVTFNIMDVRPVKNVGVWLGLK